MVKKYKYQVVIEGELEIETPDGTRLQDIEDVYSDKIENALDKLEEFQECNSVLIILAPQTERKLVC